jgi:hypothetical protein
MNGPSAVSIRLIPAEEHGQYQHGVPGQPGAHAGTGQGEQRDFGSGVEARTKEHPDRVHLGRPRDALHDGSQESNQEPAVAQGVFEFSFAELARRRPVNTCQMPSRATKSMMPINQGDPPKEHAPSGGRSRLTHGMFPGNQ